MEKKKNSDKEKNNNPKTKAPKFSYSFSKTKSQRTRKKINKIINPTLSHIKIDSKFVFDFDSYMSYFSNLTNKNNIKLSDNDLNFLKNKIDQLILLKSNLQNENIISIPLEIFNKINTCLPLEEAEDEATIYIRDLIKSQPNRESISCRKIANKYLSDTGKKISKTKVHNILRNKLNFRFLKTNIKNIKINDNINIIYSLCFIKSIIKSMKLNFKLIYIDESSIQSYNNNYRTWRSKYDQIYFKVETKKRNLIAAVDNTSVLYYEINEENTDESIFLKFMKNLKNKLEKINIYNFVVILDNLSCHKTQLLKNFYIEEKINVIFNAPYHSDFNCIEFFFRILKKRLYEKLYQSTDDAIAEVKMILNDNSLEKSLQQNFRETLENYYHYSLSHKYLNLNGLEYE